MTPTEEREKIEEQLTTELFRSGKVVHSETIFQNLIDARLELNRLCRENETLRKELKESGFIDSDEGSRTLDAAAKLREIIADEYPESRDEMIAFPSSVILNGIKSLHSLRRRVGEVGKDDCPHDPMCECCQRRLGSKSNLTRKENPQ